MYANQGSIGKQARAAAYSTHRIQPEAVGKADVATMTEMRARLQESWISRFAWIGVRSPRGRLDVRRLSDHLKRDMGFLDGNDPLGRHR
jgi:hypothetical protein